LRSEVRAGVLGRFARFADDRREDGLTILRFDDAPVFDLSGVRIRGLTSPARGATETMTYRVELAGGQRVPDHTHDHEEVSQLLSGRWTVTIDGEDSELRPGDTAVIPAGVDHATFTLEGDEAVILTSMPVGTLLIRADGERVAPPWSE
jgi:quercetin dioxygenase-like cupin family protein